MLDPDQEVTHGSDNLVDAPTEFAVESSLDRTGLLEAQGPDQGGDAFGLSEVHGAILQGPAGELAGEGMAGPQPNQTLDQGVEQHRITV